ncbi:MAG: type II toxin-antitoxin system RelE/ParE family toxin [Bacteroidota bacterium]|uniref:Type II toxin-antitoxin system RelE/ParE family toxin n=1 Tax=Pedobacter cryotolerans TaxID=2571270 RepID=A0A4U1C7J0_9SPHI|nr:type II toxin-antitoxin system RelE/ParE family toxin [Pedobacter cryotolerans]TKB99391.1 type II toxin-antitoxin system RelE/ParE family toxin [Pedobacter cryotolerans]
MALDVFYTPKAKETFVLVYNFIAEKFSIKIANQFLSKAEKTIHLISQQPFMYKSSSIDENVRIATFTKHTALFYQVKPKSINLLFFFDNRQEPLIIV